MVTIMDNQNDYLFGPESESTGETAENTDNTFSQEPLNDGFSGENQEDPVQSRDEAPTENQEEVYSDGYSYAQQNDTEKDEQSEETDNSEESSAHSSSGEPQMNFTNPNPNPYYAQQQNPYRNPYQGSYNQGYQGYQQQNPYGYNQYNNGYSQNYSVEPKKPTKGSGTGKKVVAVILAVLILAGSIGIGIAIGRSGNPGGNVPSANTDRPTGDDTSLNVSPSNSSMGDIDTVSPGIAVAEKARDSVVGVVVYDSRGRLYGEGSGVVMGQNNKGTLTYIITCAHVVSDSSIASCGVLLEDGTVYDATIVGYDERTDIAVLSVKETNLKAATFGDSTALKVGEAVYAIGNPGGSENYGSFTNGIVSALDRSITSTYTMTVIQHNAAISPGNSGGALVNSQGQVIGINSSKIAATDYEGIGFAVPIAIAKPVIDALIKYSYVPNRPKLGITYAAVSNYQAYSMIVQIKGLPAGSVIIASIAEDSAFKDTSVQVGDMITAVNGEKMTSADVLLDKIEKGSVGDKLRLSICRINTRTYEISEFTVEITLVEDKGSSKAQATEEPTSSYYDYYGNQDGFSGWGDFFKDFFGD